MYFTIKELAVYLNIKPSTLYAWTSQKKIPFIKIYGLVRFRKEEIDTWLEGLRKEKPLSIIIGGANKMAKTDMDSLIARAKREVYSHRLGETKPESALGKED